MSTDIHVPTRTHGRRPRREGLGVGLRACMFVYVYVCLCVFASASPNPPTPPHPPVPACPALRQLRGFGYNLLRDLYRWRWDRSSGLPAVTGGVHANTQMATILTWDNQRPSGRESEIAHAPRQADMIPEKFHGPFKLVFRGRHLPP